MNRFSSSQRRHHLRCRWAWAFLFSSAGVISAAGYEIQPFDDKWGDPGFGNPGGVVTWSLMPDNTPPAFSFSLQSFLPAGFHQQLEMAFAAWSSVANISFQEVSDNGARVATEPLAGLIRIGGYEADGPGGGILAFTQQPIGAANEFSGGEPGGNIGFDQTDVWSLTDEGNNFNFYRVALHEIGHAIGLAHSTDPAAVMYLYYNEETPLGLSSDDIAGAQFIYGIPEPSSLALCSFAAGMAGCRRIRRRTYGERGQSGIPLT
jgi:hypothetical protein